MNPSTLANAIARQWDAEIVPELVEYIRIPAKSPHFDHDWKAHGHIEKVIRQAEAWARKQPVRRLAVEIIRLPNRTPLLYFEVPASGKSVGPHTILLYGHLDKQPEMTGWRKDGGPWVPLIEDGKLYGRGGADDGYAVFAALSAIGALQTQGVPHARCVGLIETCEESGSYDLPAYLEAPRAASRQGRFRDRPRFRLRRLRAAMGDDVAARTRRRNAVGRRADRRRAFGRRERRRAFVVPHRAQPARPHRGQHDGSDPSGGVPRGHSGGARRAGARRRGCAG